MLRVLVITYYWPPSGGGGVQRWLKMTRFLPEFGVTPIVCHPKNADYPVKDESFVSEVSPTLETITVPVFEPFRVARKLLGQKEQKSIAAGFISERKTSTAVRLMGYIRGNFFIPDARRFWVRPTIKRLEKYLKQHPVDVVITTGPPHSVHLIGAGLKKKTNVRWIADFRDYWTDMDHSELFQMGNRAQKKHAEFERRVARLADQMVVVTPTMSAFYSSMSEKPAVVVTNGYDEADFSETVIQSHSEFIIGHYGTLGADRFAPALWDAVAAFCAENHDFDKKLVIELVGPTDGATLNYIQSGVLKDKLRYLAYTEHSKAVIRMRSAHLLLLMVNNNSSAAGRLPGKIFEYLAAERPILATGLTESDAATLLTQSGCGQMFDRQNGTEIKKFIESVFLETHTPRPDPLFIQKFTRRNLAQKYAAIIDEVAKNQR